VKLSIQTIFDTRRYWYHVSSTLHDPEITLIPRNNDCGFNRNPMEPNVNRICVGPSIAHCLTAIPYSIFAPYNIYRTKSPVRATRSHDVFDTRITLEGWLLKPTRFIKIGAITMKEIARDNNIRYVIHEAASQEGLPCTRKCLKWWKNINFDPYLTKNRTLISDHSTEPVQDIMIIRS